jgi:hypothetical protein
MKLITITLGALLVDLALVGCENSIDSSAFQAVADFQVARDSLRPGASDAMLEFEIDKAKDDVDAFRRTSDYKRYPTFSLELDRALASFQALVQIQKFSRKPTGNLTIDAKLTDCSSGASYICQLLPQYVIKAENSGKSWFDWDRAKTDSTDAAIDSTTAITDLLQKPE